MRDIENDKLIATCLLGGTVDGNMVQFSSHVWKKDENGNIDMSSYSDYICNGPVCTRCGAVECVYCNKEWNETGCRMLLPNYIDPKHLQELLEALYKRYIVSIECNEETEGKIYVALCEIGIGYGLQTYTSRSSLNDVIYLCAVWAAKQIKEKKEAEDEV